MPGLLASGALVVEDLGEGPVPEAALFHLLNLVGEQKAGLLITSARLPSTLSETLATADLASRLRVLPVVRLGPPDEELLAAVAVKLFADRQILPDEALLAYLLPRVERSIAGLRDVVAELDREALARKRPLTRALAAALLRERVEPSDEMERAPGENVLNDLTIG